MTSFFCPMKQFATAHKVRVLFLLLVTWIATVLLYTNRARLISLPRLLVLAKLNSWLPADDGYEPVIVSEECVFPSTDPFDPAVLHHVQTYPPLDCSNNTPHLVFLDGDVIRLNRSKLEQITARGIDFKTCWYIEVRRRKNSDKRIAIGKPSKNFTNFLQISPKHEHVVVECLTSNETVLSRSYFSLIRVRPNMERLLQERYDTHMRKNSPLETLSILVIGIDGMSKQNFQRAMPKTRDFLLNDLGAIELHKYNKIGYSTYPNIKALLTGENHTVYSNIEKKASFWFDEINHLFLWSEASLLGYRTGLALDHRDITAFHYLARGFNVTPVDYYLRPTVLAWNSDKLMHTQADRDCVGDTPEVELILDYWLQLAATFRDKTTPYFAYSFAQRLTHDNCHKASKADVHYHRFLQKLKVASGDFNYTVLVWFSDHGERFGSIRHTFHGSISTNTPYLFLVFPPWFERKYPEILRVLKINQERLTTHYDMHATIKDLLNFKGTTGNGSLKQRGISLFKEIPRERTCKHAEVPEEFCACAQYFQPQVSELTRREVSAALLERINYYTESYSDKCARLSISSTDSVLGVTTSNLQKLKARSFRVVITAKPGSGIFEGLVQINKKTDKAEVVGEVVRTNMYRGQADCVNDRMLRQFCYCL